MPGRIKISHAATAALLLFAAATIVSLAHHHRRYEESDLEMTTWSQLQIPLQSMTSSQQFNSDQRQLSLLGRVSLVNFADPKSSHLRGKDVDGNDLTEMKTAFSHLQLQSESDTTSSQLETYQRLRDSEEIWFSRFNHKDVYAELNEKQQNEQQLRAALKGSTLSVCGRPTNVGTSKDLALLLNTMQSTCPEPTSNEILLLKGDLAHGRTGNNLIEFLHALQLAHEENYQVAITSNSWVFDTLRQMWFNSSSDPDWQAKFEEAFCVKIVPPDFKVPSGHVTVPHKVNPKNSVAVTKHLFHFTSGLPLDEYIAYQSRYIQTLFRHYNTSVGDMCSGIKAVFGEAGTNAIYSAIHNRSLEGAPGLRLLGRAARSSGCDSKAALEMEPEYVKSILRPIGMLNHPIVLITDGQNPKVAERLMNDPEIGPMLRLVPPSASWVGGDITLAIMSDVFIGNPASSFSGFIAKARIALGFGHSHLFLANLKQKSGKKEWSTVCGDACIFDNNVMWNMA